MLTLTPQARAVAAFTLAVVLVTGQLNRITIAVVLLFGDAFPDGRPGQFLAGLIMVAVAVAVLYLARIAAKEAPAGWELNLAQAAVLIALIAVATDVVLTLAGVINDNGYSISGILGSNRLN